MSSSYDHQDWKPVVFRKAPAKKECAPPQRAPGSGHVRKLEADLNASCTEAAPELGPLSKLDHATRQAMAKARVEKKLSREQLAAKANVPVAVVQALETGGIVQERNALTRINNVLGTKLKFIS